MNGTNTWLANPKRSDVTLSKNSDGTCSYCENYADGFDAKRSEPICNRCAGLLPDLSKKPLSCAEARDLHESVQRPPVLPDRITIFDSGDVQELHIGTGDASTQLRLDYDRCLDLGRVLLARAWSMGPFGERCR